MTYQEFLSSLREDQAPHPMNPCLSALWLEGKGRWEEAHEMAQEIHDANGAWIHAYLHRKEGDHSNAGYWYSQAGRKMPHVTLESEWEDMVKEFLARDSQRPR